MGGYALSHAERSRLRLAHKSVIYGEVVPESFHRALGELAPRDGEVFFDLGSGTGSAITLQLEQLRPGARVLSVGQRLASPELAWRR